MAASVPPPGSLPKLPQTVFNQERQPRGDWPRPLSTRGQWLAFLLGAVTGLAAAERLLHALDKVVDFAGFADVYARDNRLLIIAQAVFLVVAARFAFDAARWRRVSARTPVVIGVCLVIYAGIWLVPGLMSLHLADS